MSQSVPTAVPAASRIAKARRSGRCGDCGAAITVGQRIARVAAPGGPAWIHLSCLIALQRAMRGTPGRPVDTLRPL